MFTKKDNNMGNKLLNTNHMHTHINKYYTNNK